MQDLSNKTILITGAAGLLGQHFATGFSALGARLILIDINKSLEDFAKNLKSQNDNVFTLTENLTEDFGWEKVKTFLKKEALTCDVLINNACTKSENFFAPFEKFSMDEWNQVMAVNVNAAVMGCQVIGEQMARNKAGSIINIASIYGVVAPDQSIYEGSEYLGRAINTPAVYSASKAALLGLTKYLATYWGASNVRVNAVTPGGVYSGQNETFVDRYCAKVPLNRMAEPDDILGAVKYLASDMSKYVTGQNIIVDGGFTTW
jgi:NAD(P)-dependent dehydrogenase (short-subunit alcohol dehydrogenase family)